MYKTIVSVVLVISYFYIAVWVFENFSRVMGIVFGIGVIGILTELICYLRKQKKQKKND
jgi:heme/copper-type cytochrome/quinol oxidase subunit 4